ncbi:MAG: nicotinate-nucleotide diphosphorylase (carboxylating) [Ferrovum sp. 37-45-19]|jgi:nicotinate-nucleotide pyrophosphorylase (carboxylating)|uniref:carboxylating nicotinate-nucleotide diphosphorylase n=1 Tax=Ferrovum sp. JA12 TaxID=1356299 RepID=UPI0007034715|nr:carboxylating nicotinate-nucleotide diphosphorylase [Ferrovum sp. JA12]OYV80363.1 MAG: nicotinate-nucleotide diphosphorylase (carboxylating) [Ferrovum sp. 21-44-67]OYV95107.1 MAG: nicotinate-nucleotide diphosphorylase (carboxylating) [Ferrovum sp. 37-45-19]OZB31829.1 MAG: nicotinate-nucleotide diphosphorylase (carboxylating) [Ferrovum sp. 34-44-207]HQT80827.1 carboxylating nicotinate-nucleotide diphosphorylase [Ferrovaceae bacterium]KRH78669.1 nicotinate-nucleotide pyrophosphorylase [Ferrov
MKSSILYPAEQEELIRHVELSLKEDLGEGDLTVQLIEPRQTAQASIITREEAIICGQEWVNQVFYRCVPEVELNWHVHEGERVLPNQLILSVAGNARGLLSAERTALNYLQTLSAVASKTGYYVKAVKDYSCAIVDTRKTIPGLRLAQKYAVRVGGGVNHRMGLYDAFLIKENHILAAGSIKEAYSRATHLAHAPQWIEVEVESLAELEEALQAGVEMVLLDNMDINSISQAVTMAKGLASLEISGGVNEENVRTYAATGVQRISVGTLTKDIKAIDFSMRFK